VAVRINSSIFCFFFDQAKKKLRKTKNNHQ